ncbi:MAG TPA: MauE/DoxX family redox-associated membrane protein [Candidatus Acidoferrum sp.]|nr:MauE/DoxX family redox-associated membrane protein [Candidatus Acidoferrum sp.]
MDAQSRAKSGRILLILGRVALGVIFLVAAWSKLKPVLPGQSWSVSSVETSLAMFAMGVDSYQMVSSGTASTIAHVLPFFELVLGLWLTSGIGLRISSLISTLAICAFIYAMFSAWRRGLTINCGCFGQGGPPIGPKEMMRDGFIFLPLSIALVVGSFVVNRKPQSSSTGEAIPVAQTGG